MFSDIKFFNQVFCVSLLLIFLSLSIVFGEEGGSGETVVVEGDGFRLTQKDVDEYRSAIVPDNRPIDKRGLIAAIVRYELLSRAYFKKQKDMGLEPTPETSRTIEIKVVAAKKYIQSLLDDYVVRDDVIVSYYRSDPDKYKVGNAPDGAAELLPLDDALKKEIKFIIVEKKKNTIIEEAVQDLVAKYHVKIIN